MIEKSRLFAFVNTMCIVSLTACAIARFWFAGLDYANGISGLSNMANGILDLVTALGLLWFLPNQLRKKG